MRKVCYLLAAATCVLMIISGAKTRAQTSNRKMEWREVASKADQEDVRVLFHEIEIARVKESLSRCEGLSPIPLYAMAPSLDDWMTYCRARVLRDSSACGTLPAMIDPDLGTLCRQEFPTLARNAS